MIAARDAMSPRAAWVGHGQMLATPPCSSAAGGVLGPGEGRAYGPVARRARWAHQFEAAVGGATGSATRRQAAATALKPA